MAVMCSGGGRVRVAECGRGTAPWAPCQPLAALAATPPVASRVTATPLAALLKASPAAPNVADSPGGALRPPAPRQQACSSPAGAAQRPVTGTGNGDGTPSVPASSVLAHTCGVSGYVAAPRGVLDRGLGVHIEAVSAYPHLPARWGRTPPPTSPALMLELYYPEAISTPRFRTTRSEMSLSVLSKL